MDLTTSKTLAIQATEYDKAGRFQLALNAYLECVRSLEQNLRVAPPQKHDMIVGLIGRYKGRATILSEFLAMHPSSSAVLHSDRNQNLSHQQTPLQKIDKNERSGRENVKKVPSNQSFPSGQPSSSQQQQSCYLGKDNSRFFPENLHRCNQVLDTSVSTSKSMSKAQHFSQYTPKENVLSGTSNPSSVSDLIQSFQKDQKNSYNERQSIQSIPSDLESLSFNSFLQNQVVGFVGQTLNEPIHSALYETNTESDLITAVFKKFL